MAYAAMAYIVTAYRVMAYEQVRQRCCVLTGLHAHVCTDRCTVLLHMCVRMDMCSLYTDMRVNNYA